MAQPNGKFNLDDLDLSSPKRPIFSDRPDVFIDLADYIIPKDEIGIAEVAQTVVVKFDKPDGQTWIRCHPDPERQSQIYGFRDRNKGRKLLVVPRSLLRFLGHQVRRYRILQGVTPEGETYLWPAPMAGSMDSDIAHYNAQQLALRSWVRMEWTGLTFTAHTPRGDAWGEPKWPEQPFRELLEIALRPCIINSEEHDAIKRMQGLP
jgi:hypothetical protein